MAVWDVITFALHAVGGGGVIYFTDEESCKRNKIRTDNMWYVKRVFFCSHTEYIKLEGKSKSIAHTQVDFKVLVMEYNEQFMYKLYCCSLSTYWNCLTEIRPFVYLDHLVYQSTTNTHVIGVKSVFPSTLNIFWLSHFSHVILCLGTPDRIPPLNNLYEMAGLTVLNEYK